MLLLKTFQKFSQLFYEKINQKLTYIQFPSSTAEVHWTKNNKLSSRFIFNIIVVVEIIIIIWDSFSKNL